MATTMSHFFWGGYLCCDIKAFSVPHEVPCLCTACCPCYVLTDLHLLQLAHYSLRGGVVYQQQSHGKVGFGVLFDGETVFVVVL